jgi:hypothetical protein
MQIGYDGKLQAGLIGERLVEAGYLTRDQLRAAHLAQRETALMLGEVCILSGWLDYEKLQACLRPVRWRLGNKLLSTGKITMEQLWAALLEQRRSGKRLGAILLGRGWIDEATLENI